MERGLPDGKHRMAVQPLAMGGGRLQKQGMRKSIGSFGVALSLMLGACHPTGPSAGVPGDADSNLPFAEIAADDTITLVGTEPFWGGTVQGASMTYTTMENQEGWTFPVARFAGRAGIGFTGEMERKPIILTVTQGDCSDGMSDRTYPYTATLKIGDTVRTGCASTQQHPFTGPEHP